MQGTDIAKSLLIFTVFGLIFLFNFLSVGLEKIKKHWTLYRCNPMVMPFASFVGHDTMSNFTYCIQNMQSDFMGYLLEPLNFNVSMLGDLTGGLGEALNMGRHFFAKIRSFTGDFLQSIFSVFLSVIVEFQLITFNIKDLFQKLAATLVVLLYTVQGGAYTGESWISGPPGDMLKVAAKLCFSPDTIIKLKNGETYAMKDVPLNAVLTNNARVIAKMNISNVNDHGSFCESYYELDGGENNSKILVTGNHLIYDITQRKFIFVKDLEESRLSDIQPDETLSCLITTNHTIPIGSRLFHDWEDNQP